MKQNQMEYKPKRIDDKEAIKWIEYRMMEGRLNGSDKEPVIDEPYQAGMIAINAIYNKPQWIPVSERLPEIHNFCQLYLVTYKQGQICTAFYTETNGRSWWSIDGVEAWMPLPEPYKEIRNDA